MKKFLNFTFYLFILSVISSFSLMAKEPPKIGGMATISVQASDSGIINLGAKDTISLLEISNFINAEPSYEGKLEKVNFKEVNEIMPSSREVLKYALTFKGMI